MFSSWRNHDVEAAGDPGRRPVDLGVRRIRRRAARLPGRRRAAAQDRRHPQRNDARILEEYSCRGDRGVARALRPGHADRHHLEGTTARGRSRAADPGRGGLSQPGRAGHRARAARQPRPGATGRGSPARGRAHGGHRFQARVGLSCQLRGHGQSQGRAAGREPAGRAARGQGQGAAAALCRGIGQHNGARAGVSRRAAHPLPGDRARLGRPIRRAHEGDGEARLGESAQSLQWRRARHLHPQRVLDHRDAARITRCRPGRQGPLHRLRCRQDPDRRGPRATARRRRGAESHAHGIPRRQDAGRSAARQAGRAAHRYRCHAGHGGEPRFRRHAGVCEPTDRAVSRRAMSAGATGPVLELRDIAKRFGATEALAGVDLTLSAGEVHALIGENGAGKSTLMSVVAGALEPDRGEMRVDGRPYAPRTPLEARRRGIALIHQELSLCPHLSAAENILLGAEPARWGWLDAPAARRRAQALLDHFAHPDLTPDARVGDLPLAARQVVEICRALAADARILLMDEPTSSFQREEIERLFALIRRLAAQGIAVIYISHFLEEVREIATRYTVLRDGRSVDSGDIAGTSTGHLIAQMVGRPVAGLFPERAPVRGDEVVLAVQDIAAPPALKHASFELRRGEILGIAGLAGSGRTELVRALFGLERATSGEIALRNRALAAVGTSPSQRLDQGFGYLSEDRAREGLALPLSIADNLTATRLSACSRVWGWLDLARQLAAARQWIGALRIRAGTPAQPVRALSGGNQQKVAIGRLLYQDAEVLLLDEPTRGIDIGSRVQLYETIARCAVAGKGVLLVSSYLPELFGLCDRLAVMSRGRLSPARPIDEWTPETVLATAIGEAGL